MRFTGTSDGSMGMPKGPYDMKAVEVEKFKDGKAIEHWEFMDPAEMMKNDGPSAENMDNKMMDTTKRRCNEGYTKNFKCLIAIII